MIVSILATRSERLSFDTITDRSCTIPACLAKDAGTLAQQTAKIGIISHIPAHFPPKSAKEKEDVPGIAVLRHPPELPGRAKEP